MITGILLAAGKSRRFGRDKRLEPLADGTPMAIQSLRHLAPAVDRVVVAIAQQEDPLLKLLESEQCEVVIFPESSNGMGDTLAAAIRESSSSEGWLVALADMPYIRVTTYHATANAIRQGALIARPRYQQQPGHPVGFSHALYNDLTTLTGDRGARQFLHKYENEIEYLTTNDPGIRVDIDQPQEIPHQESIEPQIA